MLIFLCMFFPTFLSIITEEYLLKKKQDWKSIILSYGFFCCLNNLFTLAILTLLGQISYKVEESISLYPAIAVKYMALSLIISFISAFCKMVLIKNVGFEIEVKNKKNS